MGLAVVIAHFGIDEDLSALVADGGIMNEDATTSHLVFLEGICDSDLIFRYEPYVAIDASMIGEVELCLFFTWGVGLVVAIVSADGDDEIIAHTARERNGDGEIAAFVFLYFLAIDVDGLLTHDGFKVEGDVTTSTFLRQYEVLTIPSDALIIATSTSLSWHQLNGMGRRDYLPRFVVEIDHFCTFDVAQMESPTSIEVPNQAITIIQRKETCY